MNSSLCRNRVDQQLGQETPWSQIRCMSFSLHVGANVVYQTYWSCSPAPSWALLWSGAKGITGLIRPLIGKIQYKQIGWQTISSCNCVMFQSVLHVLVHQIGLQFLGLYLLIPFGSSIQPFEVGTKGGDGIWVCLQANRSQNEDHEKYNNKKMSFKSQWKAQKPLSYIAMLRYAKCGRPFASWNVHVRMSSLPFAFLFPGSWPRTQALGHRRFACAVMAHWRNTPGF